jgi:hypothetical protein
VLTNMENLKPNELAREMLRILLGTARKKETKP